MSCDWHIRCMTCGVQHPFNDANHADDFMFLLITHAKAIAGLDALFGDDRYNRLELKCGWGWVDVQFFKKHCEHELAAVSEYRDIQRPGKCVRISATDQPGWVSVRSSAECIGHLQLTDCDVDVLILDVNALPVVDWLLKRAKDGQRVPGDISLEAGARIPKYTHIYDTIEQIHGISPRVKVKYGD